MLIGLVIALLAWVLLLQCQLVYVLRSLWDEADARPPAPAFDGRTLNERRVIMGRAPVPGTAVDGNRLMFIPVRPPSGDTPR